MESTDEDDPRSYPNVRERKYECSTELIVRCSPTIMRMVALVGVTDRVILELLAGVEGSHHVVRITRLLVLQMLASSLYSATQLDTS